MTPDAQPAPGATRRLLGPLVEEEEAFHEALSKALKAKDTRTAATLARRHVETQTEDLQTVRKYEALRDLALANIPLDERLVLLLSGTRTLLDSDVASVLLLDAEGKELWPRASVGFETAFGAKPVAVNGRIKKVLEDDAPLLVDAVLPKDHFRAEIAEEGIRSLIAAPMHIGGRVGGVLVCGHKREGHYRPQDLELLVIVAHRIGVGLGRTHMLQEVSRERSRARLASSFKTELLQMATHDLKTPLSALTVHLHMMAEFEQTEEERRKSVAVMRRNVDRLNVMLDEFLDLARVEAGRLVIKPVPLEVPLLLAQAVETFLPKAKGRGMRLAVADSLDGLKVSADPSRVAQVIANLVSNALRYAPKGSTVTLGAKARRDMVELYVTDEGLGLTEEQIGRLFVPFSQVQNVPEEAQGTGLGLYLSRAIVRAHGGRLWLESAGKGKGTRAAFTLPRVRS